MAYGPICAGIGVYRVVIAALEIELLLNEELLTIVEGRDELVNGRLANGGTVTCIVNFIVTRTAEVTCANRDMVPNGSKDYDWRKHRDDRLGW